MKCFFTYLEKIYIFVKEKRNLFPFDVWACGDIEPLPNLNRNNYSTITYSKSTTYHINGDYGIIATNTTNNKKSYIRYWIDNISHLIGHTISFSCNVKTLNEPLDEVIYQYDGTSYTKSLTEIPRNTENNYYVTAIVKDTTIAFWIGIDFHNIVNQGASFYTDNWRLLINDS